MPDYLQVAFVLVGIGIVIGIILAIYRLFDHGHWEDSYSPDPNAQIIDVQCKHIYLGNRNRDKIRTTVRFKDGYYFVTYKTKYEGMGIAGLNSFRYRMSIDEEEIITKANKAHEKAVERKLSSKSNK